MAAAAPEPTGPVYSIASLARIPIKDGMKASEIAHLCSSQAHTAETLALVMDIQAHALRRVMARTRSGPLDSLRARPAAWKATRPMRQAANRARGSAASSRAAWKATVRAFAPLIHPSPAKRGSGGPNWRG